MLGRSFVVKGAQGVELGQVTNGRTDRVRGTTASHRLNDDSGEKGFVEDQEAAGLSKCDER